MCKSNLFFYVSIRFHLDVLLPSWRLFSSCILLVIRQVPQKKKEEEKSHQHDDIPVRVDCPCNTDLLPLSSTQIDPLLSNFSLVSAWKDFNVRLQGTHVNSLLVSARLHKSVLMFCWMVCGMSPCFFFSNSLGHRFI